MHLSPEELVLVRADLHRLVDQLIEITHFDIIRDSHNVAWRDEEGGRRTLLREDTGGVCIHIHGHAPRDPDLFEVPVGSDNAEAFPFKQIDEALDYDTMTEPS